MARIRDAVHTMTTGLKLGKSRALFVLALECV
jgi:hypothetical protein